MRRLILGAALFLSTHSYASGGFLGVQVGHVGLLGQTSVYGNTIGFGLDLGISASSFFDVVLHVHYSNHPAAGGLRLIAPTAGVLVHLIRRSELLLDIDLGPGFYLFTNSTTSVTDFGLHAGIQGDVVLEEKIRLGLGFYFNKVFDTAAVGDNFFTLMMRLAWQFGD